MALWRKSEQKEAPPPPPRDTQEPGRGLPTRTLPMLMGGFAVAAALYVAFFTKNHPVQPAAPQTVAQAPGVNPQASPHKSELKSILDSLNQIEAEHGDGKAAGSSSDSGGNAVTDATPTPEHVHDAAKRGNIAASPLTALTGDYQTGRHGSGNHDTGVVPEYNAGAGSGAPNGQLQGPAQMPSASEIAALAGHRQHSANGNQAYLKQSQTEAQANGGYGAVSKVLPPLKGAVLYPGVVLPATTVTAVNTQLPGTVIAQVTNPVWGRNGHLAVPAGSRLVGSYDTSITNGQTRVLVAFQRVIFPDGREIVLGNSQAVGEQGASGVKGHVDDHFWTMLGSSLLVAMLDQGVAAAGPQQSVTSPTGSVYQSPTQAGAQVFANSAGKVLSPFMNMQSTAVIPPGTAIDVLVNKTILMPSENR
ncbi:hypothetical protein BI364_07030 [Acidihalobacter yilgarnensis]|uniref:Conjugal transfer protein TrbI n=1 Tax=Acidihalobacter yilgarnensis TaxID=2819280 RepID=A0A1D8IMU6_9GAMM|nr:TrbI/VirB10 family protein [Acidihalobacter yilgarnensis]AOU97745.1 hypothetical protein BI364_07030 [Acidihalobacter yilgarnensis]